VYEPSDDHLWRTLFLRYAFDDPRPPVPGHPYLRQDVAYPWRAQLCARMALERRPGGRSWSERGLDDAAELVLRVLSEAPPAPAHTDNIPWLELVLKQHHGLVPLPSEGSTRADAEPGVQARARLGAGLALACEDLGPSALLQLGLFSLFRGSEGSEVAHADPRVRALRAARRAVRARVYDLRRYTHANGHGAFFDADGCHAPRVNWTHAHAQIAVVCMNVLDLAAGGTDEVTAQSCHLRPPRGVRYLRENSAPVTPSEEGSQDWAGVAGQWRRLVCFMDYRYEHIHTP
jgi:hypothetical protein